jgi:ribosomal protein S18 acetylase RimI-like enzyme
MLLELAKPADEPELRRLLRENPMDGEIRLSLEREPNFFLAAAIEGDRHQVVIARDADTRRVVGMGQCSVRTAYVNGQPTRVGYLHQLRVDRSYRGRGPTIARGHRELGKRGEECGAHLYFSMVVADNRPARRFLEAGAKCLPFYLPLEPFVTLALPVKRVRRRRLSETTLERGSHRNLDEIVACLRRNGRRYQLASRWGREDLLSPARTRGLGLRHFHLARRNGNVVGCLALWDQRSFKQTVIRGYGARLARFRPLVNLAARCRLAPTLPVPGEELRSAFISHVAVNDDDRGVFLDLLAEAYRTASNSQLDYLLVGFAARNELSSAVREAYPWREYTSLIYLVCWQQSNAAPILLDGRCPQPEIAVL